MKAVWWLTTLKDCDLQTVISELD